MREAMKEMVLVSKEKKREVIGVAIFDCLEDRNVLYFV
jgi:hypothetical protein